MRASLSSLHSELEIFIRAMQNMRNIRVSRDVCNGLFLIVEDSFRTRNVFIKRFLFHLPIVFKTLTKLSNINNFLKLY